MLWGVALVLGGRMAWTPARAQQQPALGPVPQRYDVASIRVDREDGWGDMDQGEGTLVAEKMTLARLLFEVYGIRDAQISGLPDWGRTERFDIRAKVLEADPAVLRSLTDKQQAALVVHLLEDRFGLRAHEQLKTLPVFSLELAKGGPKFRPHLFRAGEDQSGGGDIGWRNGAMVGTAVSMGTLADSMIRQVGRPVVDRTGLGGRYDLELRWTPERLLSGPDAGLGDAPPIFLALPEQLGLKLVPGKTPVETLVIDHVEQPSEN